MNQLTLAMLPAIVFVAITFDLIRRHPRRGLFFGVTTDAAFSSSPDGLAISRRYRLIVAFGSLLAVAMAFQAPSPAALLLQIAIGLLAWFHAWRSASRYAVAPASIRSAPLQYDEPVSPWIAVFVLVSFTILAFTAATLYINYDSLPNRFPTHYNMAGAADAFSPKSFAAVFLPLLMGALGNLLLALFLYGIVYGTRRGGTPEMQAYRSAHRQSFSQLLALMSFVIALMFGYLSLSPLAGSLGLPGGPWLMFGFVVAIVGLALYGVVRLRRQGSGPGDDTPDACWKGGMIYYNSNDSALMVERRDSLGYTPNFAQPLGWAVVVLVAAMVAVPLLLPSVG